MPVQPRAVVSVELPTPLQQVKLDALLLHLRRANRQVWLVKDDSQLPDAYHRDDAVIIWVVEFKGHPEGIVYLLKDGRTLDTYAHKGLWELVMQHAQAGEWLPPGPVDFFAQKGVFSGELPDRERLEELHRKYGWID